MIQIVSNQFHSDNIKISMAIGHKVDQ